MGSMGVLIPGRSDILDWQIPLEAGKKANVFEGSLYPEILKRTKFDKPQLT